jgi:transposase InsO family protein
MRNCKGIKVLAIIKELNGIDSGFIKLCSRSEIEHRLTQPVTPKTNGMVKRVNGTIKNATVKAIMYQNIDEMKQDLNKFLIFF